ncbi:MAG: ATPase associated with various cellular activity 3 [Clostridiales bacterium]|jgi:MoxR-like ATPase|nr:ATPase associated with various cellular activity 3 [Clostridiales bacterium]
MKITMTNLRKMMEAEGYITSGEIITTVFLALKLKKPLLVTGPPGVGKTELAKVLAAIFNTELIRLQCYEGLDENKALYEWNYQKQLLQIQLSNVQNQDISLQKDLFSSEYLLDRPLLKALRSEEQAVLLIDEIDKTDEEFEAFLFEVLSDFQVSIPEYGTVKACKVPVVILTSNGERELSDGLKRRCAFLNIGYPSVEKEAKIISAKVPGISQKLAMQVAAAVHVLRKELEVKKQPAISESIDWARALMALGHEELNPSAINSTTGMLYKNQEDIAKFKEEMGAEKLLSKTHTQCKCCG